MNPRCQACGLRPTEEVHHVEPIADAPHRAYDAANLMALCRDCHAKAHRAKGGGRVRLPRPILRTVVVPVDPAELEGRRRAAQLIG